MKDLCTIGLGTHKPFTDGGGIVDYALTNGCRVIDTAPNYAYGRNQEIVGEKISKGSINQGQNHDVIVSTKVGFVPPNVPLNELYALGVRPDEIVNGHCISPPYIRYQVGRNREALAWRKISVLFIHNPEVQFTRKSSILAARVLQDALEVCEELALSGDIVSYGFSTWRGLLDQIGLSDITARFAASVGAKHHFSAVQLPISMVRQEHIAQAWFEKRGPLVEARELGMTVFANSSLHGGELVRIINRKFSRLLDPFLTPAQVAINFVRSTKFVDVILVGTNNKEHLDQALAVPNLDSFPSDLMERVLTMID